MAKFAVVALVLATMLVAGMAAEDAIGFSRSLKQQAFKCNDAKRLQNGGCDQVGACLRKNSPNLATANNIRLFNTACANCANAAKTCPATNDLPQACRGGLSNAAIMKCVNELLAGH